MRNILNSWNFNEPTEIDWANEYMVYALNLSTMQFENTSVIGPKSRLKLNLYYGFADYSEEIAEMAKKVNATFLIYSTNHFVVGFVEELE